MNYTKRCIKKYTHRKTYNKKTNIKIMRKTRRNFKGRRVMTGGTCQYSPMPDASNYTSNVFEPIKDRQYVTFIGNPETIEEEIISEYQ